MKFSKAISIYLTINIIYIIPVVYLTVFGPETISNVFYPDYISSMIFYYLFRLTYVHILLSIVLIFLLVCKHIYKKSKRLFFISLSLAVADILLNIFWVIFGVFWTIQ